MGGSRRHAVLAVLLLHRGEVVSLDRLVDELWGEHPPPTAAKTVQVYVSRLRKVLGTGILETHGRGYPLSVRPDEVDADRFDSLAADGRRALEAGDPQRAAELLASALKLWRGPRSTSSAMTRSHRQRSRGSRRLASRHLKIGSMQSSRVAAGASSCRSSRCSSQSTVARAADRGTDARAVQRRPPIGSARRLSNIAIQARR